jgi:hypothetical protein
VVSDRIGEVLQRLHADVNVVEVMVFKEGVWRMGVAQHRYAEC